MASPSKTLVPAVREIDRENLREFIARSRPDLDELGRAAMFSRVLDVVMQGLRSSAAPAFSASEYHFG
jgi:hypothetical protein